MTKISTSNDALKSLFTVVIGLAIAQAVNTIVIKDTNTGLINIDYKQLPMFIGLFITIIPFYQGASRYLDQKHSEEIGKAKRLDGLIDFMFFIIEAVLFYAVAMSMAQPKLFFNFIIVLLIVDVLWLGFVYNNDQRNFKELSFWFILNVVSIVVLFVFNYGNVMVNNIYKWSLMSFLLVIRSVIDYYVTWGFYYPEKKNG